MEGELRPEDVVLENQGNEEEVGIEVNFEVVDDDLRAREIWRVVVDLEAEDAGLREIRQVVVDLETEDASLSDRIVTNLGTTANPIEVGDLRIHSFQFEEILLNFPPLHED